MSTVVQDGRVVAVNDATWEADVFQSQQPVLLDFWAEWCSQCKALDPVLDQVAMAMPRLKIMRINVFEHPIIAQQLGVQSLPTLLLVNGGRVCCQLRPASARDMLEAIDLTLHQ